MKTIPFIHRSATISAALITTLAISAKADISPEAMALAKAVNSKLAPAKTIQLTATHKVDAELSASAKLNKGALNITVKRPNQCYVLQAAGTETRELAYDGKTLSLIQPELKLHSLESLNASTI